MLVPKKNRLAVYQYLFQEGVLVAKQDYALPKHPDIDVPNLQVLKLMQSLTSRGFTTKQFSWMYHYYYLTNEGIEYLREYLHLPAEIIPNTLKKAARPQRGLGGGERGERGDRGDRRERRDDRFGGGEFRRGPPRSFGDDKEKAGGPGGDFKPTFRGGAGGGFGRGRPQQ